MKTLTNILRGYAYQKDEPLSTSDILSGRPTQGPRELSAIQNLLIPSLTESCTCDQHSQDRYCNYPASCHNEHLPSDLIVHPHRRPLIVDHEAQNHPYNALFLARTTVKYFSRPENDMDDGQRHGLQVFRHMVRRDGLMQKLNVVDCSKTLDSGYMLEVVRTLSGIFFFGEELVGRFRWEGEANEYKKENSQIVMSLHSRAYDETVEIPRAFQRLSALLHDLSRIFLKIHACAECTWAYEDNFNAQGRGRAWQIVAKAIEEVGPQILLVPRVDLRRLACLVADVQDGGERPSRHDLQIYGFFVDILETVDEDAEDPVDGDDWVYLQ
jgi:hypothetical protein